MRDLPSGRNGKQINAISSTGFQSRSGHQYGRDEEKQAGDTGRFPRGCRGDDSLHVHWETPHLQHK